MAADVILSDVGSGEDQSLISGEFSLSDSAGGSDSTSINNYFAITEVGSSVSDENISAGMTLA